MDRSKRRPLESPAENPSTRIATCRIDADPNDYWMMAMKSVARERRRDNG